jgi:hypothetical protein
VWESQRPHYTRYWILAVSKPIAHDIFTHDTYFCLYRPVSLGHRWTLPDNHYADTLLLCVPTVWRSESRDNLCILFEQHNYSAYASRLEFQFLSVRHTKTRSSRSATLCFKLTSFGIQQHQARGRQPRGMCESEGYWRSLMRITEEKWRKHVTPQILAFRIKWDCESMCVCVTGHYCTSYCVVVAICVQFAAIWFWCN